MQLIDRLQAENLGKLFGHLTDLQAKELADQVRLACNRSGEKRRAHMSDREVLVDLVQLYWPDRAFIAVLVALRQQLPESLRDAVLPLDDD